MEPDPEELLPGTRAWSTLWNAFRGHHARWLERFPEGEPIYLIPKDVVAALGKSIPKVDAGHRSRQSLLTADELEAEKGGRTAAVLFSFTSSCQRNVIDPFANLRHLPTYLAAQNVTSDALAALLPDRWAAVRPAGK
jgi:hypothetical protein